MSKNGNKNYDCRCQFLEDFIITIESNEIVVRKKLQKQILINQSDADMIDVTA